MPVCPECREAVLVTQDEVTFGYVYTEDAAGNRVDEAQALFHRDCWPAWKARLAPAEEEMPDPDQLIEDIEGGRPTDP